MNGMGAEFRGGQNEPHPVAVARTGVGGEAVELDDRPVYGVVQRQICRLGVEEGAEAGEGLVELSPGDVVLGLVVAEQRAAADADSFGDGVEGGSLEPALAEELEGRLLDLRVGRCLWPSAGSPAYVLFGHGSELTVTPA